MEAFFVLSNIENGNLKDYFYTKCALKQFLRYNIYDLKVPEYKEDNEEKKEYISLVYISLIYKHIYSQINTGLIENVELTEPLNENYSNMNEITDHYFKTNAFETLQKCIDIYRNQPKYHLIQSIINANNLSNELELDNLIKSNGISDILTLRYKGKKIISYSNINSIFYSMYMNQPTNWQIVVYYNISSLRNTLFLYSNILRGNFKFKTYLFVNEDRQFRDIKNNEIREFRFSNTTHITDPVPMFLYKRRLYARCLSHRIYLYRVILRLVLRSSSSNNLISNLKTSDINNSNDIKLSTISQNLYSNNKNIKIENKMEFQEKNSLNDDLVTSINKSIENNDNKNYFNRNEIHYINDLKIINNNNYNYNYNYINNKDKNVLIQHLKLENDNSNKYQKSSSNNEVNINNQIYNERSIPCDTKKFKINQDNINDHRNKYWINNISYMEMENNEMNEFFHFCIYHQITFILKNIISKCIDFLLNNYMYYERLAKLKVNNLNKPHYYEFSSILSLYEIGISYLSKYVVSHDENEFKTKTKYKIDEYNLYDICEPLLELINNSEKKEENDITLEKPINDLIDQYYYKNINARYKYCKYCCRYLKKNWRNDNERKEDFIEILKLLKYFYNIDEFIPQNCPIYKSLQSINKYLYTNSSLPTYQYFLEELISISKYFKEVDNYIENFKYLIEQANFALRNGKDSFEINTLNNLFF
ncbi:hypothetical protein LY90DRAFT_678279 [Neocallimastix californiae]|uniref:Uncharacterized protein n=1 Tax=Neocallimastix californiae TaxID=1754190 RepID=A0A1Y1ZCN5_9FUNG|nr:hypothetical protein LY90DRAFT_678279 [Neocallimastix californiae]|eukprot:ORY07575.1 hypothetical protein LY90DRAFT_678279 [Neocallimastix californiae]